MMETYRSLEMEVAVGRTCETASGDYRTVSGFQTYNPLNTNLAGPISSLKIIGEVIGLLTFTSLKIMA
jgi:hypothetical protein